MDSLGGELALFDLFHSQIPWTTPPAIEPEGAHGRTVRSNWYHVVEPHQPDPHDTVCDICETLLALSPRSDAAASDAVDPMGRTIAVGDFKLGSKNMPRANIPAKARVAWNVAFRQVLLARSADYSLTDYTHRMALLVQRTEKVFRSITEKWIKRKRISNANTLLSEINEIVDTVNALAYSAPENPPSAMTEPVQAGTDNTLGALLTGVLGNLIGRLSNPDTAKGAATFAGSLAGQAREHHQSDIWRTMSSPPLKDLSKLAERLTDVSCILHEMTHNRRPDAIQRIVTDNTESQPREPRFALLRGIAAFSRNGVLKLGFANLNMHSTRGVGTPVACPVPSMNRTVAIGQPVRLQFWLKLWISRHNWQDGLTKPSRLASSTLRTTGCSARYRS